MTESDWKARLREAIEGDSRSKREISTAAGLGYNYISQVLSDSKTPTVDNFVKLCRVLGVSPIYIMTGADVTPELETLLDAWARTPPFRRRAVLALIREDPQSE